MLAVAFIIATSLASRRAHIFNIPKDSISGLGLSILICGIIGARALYLLLNIGYFSRHPFEALLINRGGLVFYGAILPGFLAGMVFARIHKLSVLDIADLLVPFIALAHAIGRIGCFLNGCCYGRQTSSIAGVIFPYTDARIYPAQLFSSAGLFIIFLALFYQQGRRRFKGQILLLYFIIYGIFRFSMDFLRGDLQAIFLGLTISQMVSAVIVLIGLALYLINKNLSHRKI